MFLKLVFHIELLKILVLDKVKINFNIIIYHDIIKLKLKKKYAI